MKSYLKLLTALTLIFSIVSIGCKKKEDEEPMPTTGFAKGQVTETISDSALSNVLISVFNSNTNEPTGKTLKTDANGQFSIELPGGVYYLRLQKQGFNPVPPPRVVPLSFTVINGSNVTQNYTMNASDVTNAGFITGQVTSGGAAVPGALVVAEEGGNAYSSISDADGNYSIFNVPVTTYQVNAWKAGHQGNFVTATVQLDTGTSDVDILMSASSGQNVSGMITFLATTNIEVDVALVHPITRETVPGLVTTTTGGSYNIANVPDGLFLGRATFDNDGKVVDPDWIVKNGEPFITVSGADVQLDFSVTGAVTLSSPTNPSTSVTPVEVASATPTFSWAPYSSASDYVIEVSDASGNVIWGGFNNDWSVKHISIPKAQNSVQFNSDGNASEGLESGRIYRWRIYASKDDAQSPSGFRLISASEDQMGLIKVQ